MDWGQLSGILLKVFVLLLMWKYNKIYKENKGLKQETERLQQELINQANENLRLKDNFNNDFIE